METQRESRDLQMARALGEKVQAAGGRAFFVGGFVRDKLLGLHNKDIDVEVHGIPAPQLEEILSQLGTPTAMGASFGVYGLKHYTLDIALPRKEHATGKGHKDFAVFTDPFLGTEKAAKRRDFTVNALMEDICTGEIVDPFGGQEDLQRGILRHVSSETFGEDPLRVLRGAQFGARFGFTLAEETKEICRGMDLTALSRERIFGELEKALLKAERPSRFFTILREIGALEPWFSELKDLIDCSQDPRYHPEGDVWNHTMGVLDGAATLREAAKEPLYFMLAALCHDLGKPQTTREEAGRIRSLGHEETGVEVSRGFLHRISREGKLQKYVLNMVELHMKPNLLAGAGSSEKAFYKVFDRSLCPEDLLLLAKADRLGQGWEGNYGETEALLRQKLADFHALMAQPFVQGRDLMEAGITPDKHFSEALSYAHKLRLAGVPKESALKQTISYLRTLQK